MKPTLKPDARHDLRSTLYNSIEATLDQNKPIYISCLNCINFKEEKEICGLVNKRPPARVIAYGCEHWEDIDTIPF